MSHEPSVIPDVAPEATIGALAGGAAPAPRGPATRTYLPPRPPAERMHVLSSLPFFLVHLTPLLIIFTGVGLKAVVLLLVTFTLRMWFITAGYHRYFSHRSYRLSRVPQFVLAFGGTTAAQKGPLWWAAHHRDHHRYADTDLDVHSPQKGFWWSHMLWILTDEHSATKFDRIKDFAKFPELRFINRFDWIGPWTLAIVCFLIDGWQGLVVGFFTSTVLLWHSTFFINSLAHVFGRRRYATEDTSRNSFLLAVLTLGEGWHNNHHYYPSAARNGFFWWEWDPTYYSLRALSLVGIVKQMKRPPEWVLHSGRVRDGSFDIGMFRAHWNKATRAVTAAHANMAVVLHERREHASGAIAEKRAAFEAGVESKKAAVEGFVTSTLESAEELARVTRRNARNVLNTRNAVDLGADLGAGGVGDLPTG